MSDIKRYQIHHWWLKENETKYSGLKLYERIAISLPSATKTYCSFSARLHTNKQSGKKLAWQCTKYLLFLTGELMNLFNYFKKTSYYWLLNYSEKKSVLLHKTIKLLLNHGVRSLIVHYQIARFWCFVIFLFNCWKTFCVGHTNSL